jgi:cytochrome c-type biogenesis protein CcmH
MEIWLIIGVLLAVVVGAFLTITTRRRGSASVVTGAESLTVYRDQLKELEREIRAGLVPATEADATRAEISRRILAEAKSAKPVAAGATTLLVPILFALLIPAIAIPAYLKTGKPALGDLPLAARLDKAIENDDMAAMIARVEKHLAGDPNDLKAWTILGPVYGQMGRFEDAANAYVQVMRLSQETAENLTAFGEMTTFANGGIVSSQAAAAFDRALKLDPKLPKARFFEAIALKQLGKPDAAREKLVSLLKDASPDANWRKAVEQELASLAKAPTLNDEQMAAGQSMSADDRSKMIRGMVDGLEAKLTENGDDVEGWLRLIRARTVLGEQDKAKTALQKATDIFKDKTQELTLLNALAGELKLQ